MINKLADYYNPLTGEEKHRVMQVFGTNDWEKAVNRVKNTTETPTLKYSALTVVHGDYTWEELEAMQDDATLLEDLPYQALDAFFYTLGGVLER